MIDDDIPELRAPAPPTSDGQFLARVQAALPSSRPHRSRWVMAMGTGALVVAVWLRSPGEDVDDWQIDVANSEEVFAFAELDGSSDEQLLRVERSLDEALQRQHRSGT
jgi:FAD/FMN-containing dehydrogenase